MGTGGKWAALPASFTPGTFEPFLTLNPSQGNGMQGGLLVQVQEGTSSLRWFAPSSLLYWSREAGERLQTQLRPHSSAEVWFSSSIAWPSGKQWQGSQERTQPGVQGHCGCCGYHSTAASEAPKEGGCYVGNGSPPPKDKFMS